MRGRVGLLPTLLVACTTSNPVFLLPDDPGDEGTSGVPGDSTGEIDATTGSATGDETGAPMTTAGASGVSGVGETGDGETGDAGETGDVTGDGTTGADTTTGPAVPCTDVCGTPGCGACPDVDMVPLPGFAIDARETANEQYAQFLAANVDPAMQPAECAWNSDFTPTVWPLPADAGALPVVNIDWCDAHAYCAWSGRRLCGGIGGGASSFGELIDPLLDQWYRACSSGTGLIYPYGLVYDADRCNGKEAGVGAPVASGSFSECHGLVPGLFDLSGNVWEWVDNCDAAQGASDQCLRRGGSFFSVADDLRCDLMSKRSRDMALDHVGVRCCAD
jgi:sulfatase modifying factor 1